MGILESILGWIAKKILEYLLGRALSEASFELEKMKLGHERDKLNDKNTEAYNSALDRAQRREAALNLLNRTP